MGNDVYTCDTFETGTRSAAFGGTTTIIDFAGQCIVDGDEWLGRSGMGEYLPRGALGRVL